MDNEGKVFVAAVNTIFVLSPNGSVIKSINVSGAEYMAYDNVTNTLYVTSGTLPAHTITEISDTNLSIIKQLSLSAYPFVIIAGPTGKVYVAVGNEVYFLNGSKLVPLFAFQGIPTDMIVAPPGRIFLSSYNFSENIGYIFMFVEGKVSSLRLDTFPNSLLLMNRNDILVGTDGYLLEVNFSLDIIGNVSIYGSKIDGLTYDSTSKLVYAAVDSLYGQDYVLTLDNMSPIGEINVGITPIDIAFDPVSGYVFVSNFFDGTVAIISQGCPNSSNYTITLPVSIPSTPSKIQTMFPYLPVYAFLVLSVILSAIFLNSYINKNRNGK
ncbi:hypothetical protein [Metallosphaera javensis (ex Sakai et al. 2022)]|uniref:hypothetical protein n=1 Tax=Metallosphaera javensis (ex Sakai et al. 2022) TaxID=2775498 RepID=UPI002590BA42